MRRLKTVNAHTSGNMRRTMGERQQTKSRGQMLGCEIQRGLGKDLAIWSDEANIFPSRQQARAKPRRAHGREGRIKQWISKEEGNHRKLTAWGGAYKPMDQRDTRHVTRDP